MKDRLLMLLEVEKMTSMKFAEIMEVRPSGISHLLSGRNNPNFEFISKLLLRFPEINPDWLLNGQGNMYRGDLSQVPSEPMNAPIVTNLTPGESAINSIVDIFQNKEMEVAVHAIEQHQVEKESDSINFGVLENVPKSTKSLRPNHQQTFQTSTKSASEISSQLPLAEAESSDSKNPQSNDSQTAQNIQPIIPNRKYPSPRKMVVLYDDMTFEIYNSN